MIIKMHINYIPCLISFKDGQKGIYLIMEGSEDRDGDPYFCHSIIYVNGLSLPKETFQLDSNRIESIVKLKEDN